MNEKIKIAFDNNFRIDYQLVKILEKDVHSQYAIIEKLEGIIAVLSISIDENRIIIYSVKAVSELKFSNPYFLRELVKFIDEVEEK